MRLHERGGDRERKNVMLTVSKTLCEMVDGGLRQTVSEVVVYLEINK